MHASTGTGLRRIAVGLMAAAAVSLLVASPAQADVSAVNGSMKLTVSQAGGLPEKGATVRVRGSGFDTEKGIYVAVCVDPGPGRTPTPCLGGMDTSGGAGGSAWISSNPPGYGRGLATPFGPGGTFDVKLAIVAVDPVTGTDCRKQRCSIVSRADHTRTSDRSSDVRIPITFGPAAGGGAVTGTPTSSKPRPVTTAPTSGAWSSTVTPRPATTPAATTPAATTAAVTTSTSSAPPATSSTSIPAPIATPSAPSTAATVASTTATTAGSSPSETPPAPATDRVDTAADSRGSGGSGWIGWVTGGVTLAIALLALAFIRRRATR